MASLRHMPPPGGDKASGLDGDLQGRRIREDGTPRGRREGQDPLSRRRSRAWVADLVILVLVAAAVVGILYLYRYLRNTYAPVWEKTSVVWTLELKDVDPELIAYDRSGDMVLLGKNVYNSEQEDADLLGTVTDVWLLRVTETGQPDTVTLYLTVEATASYRAGKGYWMNDTRLLCGDERSFRMAGLEARGTVIAGIGAPVPAADMETAPAADTAWDAEDSSATDTQP